MKLIELLECKTPNQIGKFDDPNYCKYHCILSRPVQNCFILRELVIGLAKEGKIDIDFDDVAMSKHATIVCGLSNSTSPTLGQGEAIHMVSCYEIPMKRRVLNIMTKVRFCHL